MVYVLIAQLPKLLHLINVYNIVGKHIKVNDYLYKGLNYQLYRKEGFL